ncbi:2-aminoethylphosphonate ABC transporter permease subunit [Leifsonia shinshuensis]|uniref:2-aminoethylphosphonate transport system permease protein n=1 Tax=Leifsonia shinshuensis TaxID=150026 RepID=A0A853CRA8_9MICO|nr:2-aminoethylphosphonate ABC transporter permease subunit [Leifsonia shinshuensis]NYJ22868.1 2-aminoethylphosphonate transport system permease protein [Leifsonia shinshuensis]
MIVQPALPVRLGRAPRSRRAAGRPAASRGWLWTAAPAALLALFVLLPLAEIVVQSFLDDDGHPVGLSGWAAMLGSPSLWRSLGTTLGVAAASTAGCLVVGAFLAFVLVFVPFRGSAVVRRAIETVVSFPSFLIPLAFVVLYGNAGVLHALLGPAAGRFSFTNSVAGVVVAEITFYTPFIVAPLIAAFSGVSADQLNVAGSLGAGPLRIIRTIVLPEAAPALGAASMLTFLLTMNEFGIVLFTGAKDVLTLPMQIYTSSIVSFDFSGAAIMAVVQVVLSVGLYLLYRWAAARWTGGAAPAGRGRRA